MNSYNYKCYKNSIKDWINFYFNNSSHFGLLSEKQFDELSKEVTDLLYSLPLDYAELDSKRPIKKPARQYRQVRSIFPEFKNIIDETNRRLKNDRR